MQVAPFPLRGGLGRRLLALFLFVAILPIAVIALLSHLQVVTSLRAERDAELVQAAKSYGLTLMARLGWIETLLANGTVAESAMHRLTDRIEHEIEGVAVLDAAGVPLLARGRAPHKELLGSPSVLFAASRHQKALAFEAGADGRPVMLVRRPTDLGEPRFLAVALSPTYLWGERDLNPALTDFCVLDEAGRRLHCSDAAAERVAESLAGNAATLSGAMRWAPATGGSEFEAVLVGAWSLFISSRYAGPSVTILAMQPEAHALRPAGAFQKVFLPLAALTAVLVTLISIGQIRRILVPLQKILAGTRRLQAHDFTAPVRVDSRDELGEVATAFNAMSAHMGLHLRTMAAYADIDRAILTAGDLRDVADTAVCCARDVADVAVAIVALIDPADESRLCVRHQGKEVGRAHSDPAYDSALLAALPAPGKWHALAALPAKFASLLRDYGAGRCHVFPVRHEGKPGGALLLGDRRGDPLSPDQLTHLAGVTDRLSVALNSAARDRQLRDQAHYDALTGLPNRHYLLEILGQEVSRARRDGDQLGIMFVDLDHFKRTNDTLGHAAGDQLLQLAAQRIRRVLRDTDTAARLGGDEFVVVLPKLHGPQPAAHLAHRLISTLAEPFGVGEQNTYAGASIGIALFPDDGDNVSDLMVRADIALYRAKELGRGRFVFFEERMNAEAAERAVLDRELRQALTDRQLELRYQPQIDLGAPRKVGAEALLRWRHPQRGLISPAVFLTLAEETGVIDEIGLWVLHQACAQYRQWLDAGLEVASIAVNVSGRQLQRPDFVAGLRATLAATGIAAERLELEVTESLFIDGGSAAVSALSELRELGVRIAIDDFGSGYSSFAYIKQLPVSILKLDRQFIVDITTDSDAAAIAVAMLAMGRALRKDVVAEGVETEAQLAFLKAAGCTRIQGFLISKPLTAEAFAGFVRSRREMTARALPAHAGAKVPQHSKATA